MWKESLNKNFRLRWVKPHADADALLSYYSLLHSSHICSHIHGLTRLIAEPTRVTQYSSTLIDLCLTNSPGKISKSGVINIGISDHSAVYFTRKVARLPSNMHKTVEVQQLKNFNEAEFLRDLLITDWNRFTTHNNANEMWDFWKHLLASVIDKHAQFRRVKTNGLPGLLMSCCMKYMKEIF